MMMKRTTINITSLVNMGKTRKYNKDDEWERKASRHKRRKKRLDTKKTARSFYNEEGKEPSESPVDSADDWYEEESFEKFHRKR